MDAMGLGSVPIFISADMGHVPTWAMWRHGAAQNAGVAPSTGENLSHEWGEEIVDMRKYTFLIILLLLPVLAACSEGSRASVVDWVRDSGGPAAVDGAKVAVDVAAEAMKTNVPMAETAASKGFDMVSTRLADDPTYQCPAIEYSVDTDLNGVVDISGTQLDAAIAAAVPGSPLLGLGNTFVNVAQLHGVNVYFITGYAAMSSGWGNNTAATELNNLFGYGATAACPVDCAAQFASRGESIEFVTAILKTDFLTPGGRFYNGPTLAGMAPIYVPGNPQWAEGVAAHMNLLRKNTPCP